MESLKEVLGMLQKASLKAKREKEFNPLIVAGVNNKETMHSRFIAELLNPQGAHNCGNKLLNLFLEEVELGNMSMDNLTVRCEKGINGGRIDIAIENNDNIIIIENKFEAKDQPNQLAKYHKHSTSYPNAAILYLTPYGHAPSKESLGDNLKVDDIKQVSYEYHILNWLSKAQQEKGCEQMKVSLQQYEDLVRLTINRNKYMETILNLLLEDANTMAMAIDVAKSLQGRNFLQHPKIKAKIKQQVIKALENVNESSYWENPNTENSLWHELVIEGEEEDKGSICIDGAHIYAKDASGKTLENSEIVCNDINNEMLKALLCDDEERIQSWIEGIRSKLNE